MSLLNQVAQSQLGLQPMPARSAADFFVGIFYAQRKVRHVLARTREGLSEGERDIGAAPAGIDFIFGETRLIHVSAKKARAISCSKTERYEAPKILQNHMLRLWEGSHHPSSRAE